MDDLALERIHGPEPLRLPGAADLLGRVLTRSGKLGPAALAITSDVQHHPRPVSRAWHGQARELLEGLENLAPSPDKLLKRRADYGHHRPVALDVHVDVAVQVCDVEQALDVVGRDLAFLLQLSYRCGAVLIAIRRPRLAIHLVGVGIRLVDIAGERSSASVRLPSAADPVSCATTSSCWLMPGPPSRAARSSI